MSELDIDKVIFLVENVLEENGYSQNLSDIQDLVMRQYTPLSIQISKKIYSEKKC